MDDSMIGKNGLKRRNSVPSAVVIPRRLKSSPPILPNGNHNHHIHNHNHCKLTGTSPSPPTLPCVDFELVSLKFPAAASYTSLKDIIPNSPSSILSPAPAANSAVAGAGMSSPSSGSGYEISIRNRLVKQAAWAYLQPTVTSSPSSSSRRLFFSGEFFRPMFDRFRRLMIETVTRVYDWLVDMLWLILCR